MKPGKAFYPQQDVYLEVEFLTIFQKDLKIAFPTV